MVSRLCVAVGVLAVLALAAPAEAKSYAELRRETHTADGYLRLASWCRDNKRFDKEKEAVILALRANPKHTGAKARLARILSTEKQHRSYADPWRREGPNFVVETDTNEARLHHICDVVTAFCKKFRATFNIKQTPRQRWGTRIRVRLFREFEGFNRYRRRSGLTGLNKGAQGYYNFERKEIILWEVPGDPQATIQTLLHEGTHLFLHLALGPEARRLPLWLNEGIAEYFGAARYDRKRGGLFGIGQAPYHQVLYAQRILKKKGLRLHRLLSFKDQPNFVPSHYARSWSLVHMLLERKNSKGKRIYRKGFFRYVDRVGRGQDPVKAFRKTYGVVAKMASRWHRYVREYDVPTPAVAEEEFRKGRYKTAARLLSKHVKKNPRDVARLLRLGQAHSFASKFGEAAMAYERVIQLEPQHARAHARLGYSLAMQRESRRAMRSARRAVDLTPNDENYYYLAMVAFMSGEKDKAAGAIARAIALGGQQKEYRELRTRVRGM